MREGGSNFNKPKPKVEQAPAVGELELEHARDRLVAEIKSKGLEGELERLTAPPVFNPEDSWGFDLRHDPAVLRKTINDVRQRDREDA